jgi:hypothetical protein
MTRALFITAVTALAAVGFSQGGAVQNPSTAAAHQQVDLNLAPGRVGALKIGMTADEVLGLFGQERVKRVDLRLEGGFSPALEIRLGSPSAPRPSLTAELLPPPANTVFRVNVFDRRFKTAHGLGVGSTFAEIRAHHEMRLVSGEGLDGVYVEELRMTFNFGALRDFPHIPASARVQSVLVLPKAIPK